MKYEAYQPTKWEQRIDHLLGLASTRVALKRMVNRERMHWFRYLAAQPTSSRQNSTSTTAGEWLRIQREKMQVMWNAIDMVDNSGLGSGILTKFPIYICGTLRWQARTGDKNTNTAYQQYVQQKTGMPTNIDIQGRHSLRQQCMLDVKSIMLKGDVGTNIVRDNDDELYLQGIEANRIGDPYKWQTDDTYVRGLSLDPKTGRIVSVRVFYQDRRSGTYRFDAEYPTRDKRGLPQFLFFTNPISYDDYRGVSLFKHAIDNSTYIDRMRQYELQALLWAASQSGVYYTKSGALPEALPFSRTPVVDKDGNTIETYEARPNSIIALSADGERMEMFQHDRPSPNVIGMYENTINDISVGCGLTKQFTWGMTGTGPEVRMASAQDARAVEMWQQMLREMKLDNVIMLLLGNAIAKGELPYHKNWLTWDWYFPAKPTIDVGRESEASIEEMNACINTGANVVSEMGEGDIEDVIIQRGHEVGMAIDAAQEEAKKRNLPWEQVYALMIPPPRGRGQGGGMPGAAKVAADKVAGENPDKEGASDEGVEIDGGNGNGSGKRVRSFRMNDDGSITIFYRPDQARGAAGTPEGGQFVPEGGGAAAKDYAGGGKATEEIPKPARERSQTDIIDEINRISREGATPEGQARIAQQTGTAKPPASERDYGGKEAKASEEEPEIARHYPKTDDEAIDALYNPGDADKYRELKSRWSAVNNSLLQDIDTPDSPEAQAKVDELNKIVKEMHNLHADPGGVKGIGLPGGPKDIIVIGAGPAGLSTAINATTDGWDTAFIDTQPITGGQSKMSSRVENYPGFPIGVSGAKLAQNMYKQAVMRGAEAKLETQVTAMDYDPKTQLHTVHLSDGTKMTGRTIVIAGGVQFKQLRDFEETATSGIVYGDGKKMAEMGAGKSIVVLGGSNGAAQAALGAAKTAGHVTVVSRHPIGDSMSDYQVEALRAQPTKITIIENDNAKAMEYKEGVPVAFHTANGKVIPASVLGIFAGSKPSTKWLPAEMAKVTKKGPQLDKIKVNKNFQVLNAEGKVARPGVYAVGDIRAGSIQRILASAAEGQFAERHISLQFVKQFGIKKPGGLARDVSIEKAKSGEVK